MRFLLLGLFFVGSAVAQVPASGKCPSVQVTSDFNIEKFFGKWYEAERYFALYEIGSKCVTQTYTSGENGTITVVGKLTSALTGKDRSIQGTAVQNSSEKAKLSVKFPKKIKGDFWILDTDYTTYAVGWSCKNIGEVFNQRFAWILTRELKPATEVLEKAYQAIDKNGISRKFFIKTNQSDCPADH